MLHLEDRKPYLCEEARKHPHDETYVIKLQTITCMNSLKSGEYKNDQVPQALRSVTK